MTSPVTLEVLRKIEALGLAGQTVARGYYETLFNRVANKADWKAPIDARFSPERLDCELDVLEHAIVFFTGNPDVKIDTTAHRVGANGYEIRVTSAGYRAGPAGAH